MAIWKIPSFKYIVTLNLDMLTSDSEESCHEFLPFVKHFFREFADSWFSLN